MVASDDSALSGAAELALIRELILELIIEPLLIQLFHLTLNLLRNAVNLCSKTLHFHQNCLFSPVELTYHNVMPVGVILNPSIKLYDMVSMVTQVALGIIPQPNNVPVVFVE